MNELVHDLGVHELERPVALVHHRHLDAERGEHRRVLDADHARADDRQRSRQPGQTADVVARDHGVAERAHGVRGHGARAARDQHVRRGDFAPALATGDAQAMRIDERRLAAQDVHAVARKLIDDHRPFARDDFVHAREKLNDGGPLRGLRAAAIGPLRADEAEDGLAKGLAGNRPRGQARATHRIAPLDQRDALAELRRLHGAPLAGGPAADADEIVVEWIAHGAEATSASRG